MAAPLNINRTDAEVFASYPCCCWAPPPWAKANCPAPAPTAKPAGKKPWPNWLAWTSAAKPWRCSAWATKAATPSAFASGLRDLYEFVISKGAAVVGQWPTEGYEFEQSRAVVDGQFVGLVLDLSNQSQLTEARLDAWLKADCPGVWFAGVRRCAARAGRDILHGYSHPPHPSIPETPSSG